MLGTEYISETPGGFFELIGKILELLMQLFVIDLETIRNFKDSGMELPPFDNQTYLDLNVA